MAPPASHRDNLGQIYFFTIFNNEVQNFVLNGPTHIFVVRDLMADWGWSFTCPQPLPNPPLSRAKCNFQLSIQKKETEVSPRLTNLVLLYVLSINLTAKVAIFALLQRRTPRKVIASIVGCSQSTLNFDCPKNVSFRQIANFALAS